MYANLCQVNKILKYITITKAIYPQTKLNKEIALISKENRDFVFMSYIAYVDSFQVAFLKFAS